MFLLWPSTSELILIFFWSRMAFWVLKSSFLRSILLFSSTRLMWSIWLVIQSFCTLVVSSSTSLICFLMLSRMFSAGPLSSSPSPLPFRLAHSRFKRSTCKVFYWILSRRSLMLFSTCITSASFSLSSPIRSSSFFWSTSFCVSVFKLSRRTLEISLA